jgi:hypothetical protein
MTIEYPIITQAADGSITRALPPRTPTAHTHGGITNAGAIGTTADLILGTGTAGAIETRTASQVRTLLGLATDSDVVLNGLTITETNPNVTPFSLSGYSITGSNAQSMLSLAGTWNTTGTPTAIDLDVTDTASNLNSLLIKLARNAVTRFSVNKLGGMSCITNDAATASVIVTSNTNTPELRVRTSAGSGVVLTGSNVEIATGSNLTNRAILTADAANTFHQRNGTNGQIARWAKTWTSATILEAIELDCAGNATTFDLAVCSGSAGGSNRGLRIGQKFAGGAFSSWLEFSNTGVATFAIGGTNRLRVTDTSLYPMVNNAFDLGIPGAAFRDLLLTRDLTLTPSASRTLSTNGQFTIEMTSNTAGNLVYRGSDGTTRRMALTFT